MDGKQTVHVALFPGPSQLFVACSMEKQGEPGISIFSLEDDVINKWPKIQNEKAKFLYCSMDYKFNTRCV